MHVNLVYIHIGKNIPDYLYDSIYQALLVSPNTKIYVVIDDVLISKCREKINDFNTNLYLKNQTCPGIYVECIPISVLKISSKYTDLIKKMPNEIKEFRDAFWISTTARFFYIESLINLYQLNNVFHIETDVMLYINLNELCTNINDSKMYMVKDSPGRVVPSILYIPNQWHINLLNSYIITPLNI